MNGTKARATKVWFTKLVSGAVFAAAATVLAPTATSATTGPIAPIPASAQNNGSVTVKVCGAGVQQGAQITLERAVEGAPIAGAEGAFAQADLDGNCFLNSSMPVTFDLSGHAPGAWTLVVHNADGSTSQAGFGITAAAPAFDATPVAPSTVNVGSTVDVTIRGTALYRGVSVSSADGDTDAANDVVVESRSWVDTQTVTARLRIPTTAPLQRVDIVVTNTDQQSRTCIDCLLVDDVNRRFVDAVYAQLLGRSPDPSGRSYWLDQLRTGRPRTDMAIALVASDEFRGRVVHELFRSILGRPADPAGVAYWIGVLRDGHPYATVQASLLGSPEFLSNVGGSRSRFLDAAYVYALGRLPDQAGRAYWNQQMDSGLPRATVAFVLATSVEARVRLVDAYYRTFLRRPADGPGINYWTLSMVLLQVREEVVVAVLVGSDEFKAING